MHNFEFALSTNLSGRLTDVIFALIGARMWVHSLCCVELQILHLAARITFHIKCHHSATCISLSYVRMFVAEFSYFNSRRYRFA